MELSENNRISQRQLQRQILLAYLTPICLCFTGKGRIQGKEGIIALCISFCTLLLYVIFLIRLYPVFGNLRKSAGDYWGKVIGIYFTFYVILTAAVLLSVLEEVLPLGFLIGVPKWQIGILAALVCSVSSYKGMQRRGRMAEVTGGILLLGILFLLLFSLKEGKTEYLQRMISEKKIKTEEMFRQWYGCICGFSGISLLPFCLGNVEKRSNSRKSVVISLGILFGILAILLFLLPAVLGWERIQQEIYPILPLLAGTDLPGNVLARFDVIWMCLLLFGLLFSLGSLFFYGSHILQTAKIGQGRWWIAGLAFLLSMDWIKNWSIRGFYFDYLKFIFVPGTVLLHVFFLIRNQNRKKIKAITALFMSIFLSGCAGVEPEKRLYPLAMAVDYETDGTWKLYYGMANLAEKTGQGKEGEENQNLLILSGNNFDEIQKKYNMSQEKYLDLGHLQVLILGTGVLNSDAFDQVLMYLLEEPMTGEDLYLFWSQDIDAVMKNKKTQDTSVGDYLKGIYENRAWKKDEGVTLREGYACWYQNSSWRKIPEIRIEGEELVILERGNE